MATFDEFPEASMQMPDDVVSQANDRYWNSDAGVNQLARDLELSKGTLYEIIAPLPADVPCPQCDGELAFTNRTARERGFVSCPACGLEDDRERVLARLEEVAHDPTIVEPPTAPDPAVTDPPAAPGRSLETLLVVTALAGVAAGLILGGLLRRR
ncbi:MAG: hypothetical protein OXH51_01870 [Gemmatimonadetes bacterium]|nr:hypothetical protein [Gemmatimonadota bacterium]MCY3610258.1 hypothetical protein [Gemmatimonadota bacterium]MCY3677123.1 hypothetical protein [Gemmatimonadota bacterium]MYA40640.1 hypothetical protein [Gemmatimonadota bacterium]MYE93711.1 hypothetical protein [Gemmatimonadota bacterium]